MLRLHPESTELLPLSTGQPQGKPCNRSRWPRLGLSRAKPALRCGIPMRYRRFPRSWRALREDACLADAVCRRSGLVLRSHADIAHRVLTYSPVPVYASWHFLISDMESLAAMTRLKSQRTGPRARCGASWPARTRTRSPASALLRAMAFDYRELVRFGFVDRRCRNTAPSKFNLGTRPTNGLSGLPVFSAGNSSP